MLKSVEGVFKNGKIELLEPPPAQGESRVVVTFMDRGVVDLRQRGIDETQAVDLRARLEGIAEDWNRPDMDVYDEQ